MKEGNALFTSRQWFVLADFSLPCHRVNPSERVTLGKLFEGGGHGVSPRLGAGLGDSDADFGVSGQVGGRVEPDEL